MSVWKILVGIFSFITMGGLISVLTLFFSRWDLLQKRKKEDFNDKFSNSVDVKRLENEARDKNWGEVWQILNVYKEGFDECQKKLKLLEGEQDLSSLEKKEISRAMRELDRQISNVENLAEQGEKPENIVYEMGVLRQKYDAVNNLLN